MRNLGEVNQTTLQQTPVVGVVVTHLVVVAVVTHPVVVVSIQVKMTHPQQAIQIQVGKRKNRLFNVKTLI